MVLFQVLQLAAGAGFVYTVVLCSMLVCSENMCNLYMAHYVPNKNTMHVLDAE